jgi:hypothetical protein
MLGQEHGVAVIADVVGSRRQPDRRAAQQALVAGLEEVNALVPAVQPLRPTVGDESQGIYADLPAALLATLLLRLVLSPRLDCRFGIAVGWYETVSDDAGALIQDGSAWWSAREAILEAKARESGRDPALRTWFAGEGELAAITNAYLLSRDQLVTHMSDRSRRLLLGLLLERSQTALAEEEGISPSAVSQNLRKSGALAVLGGMTLLRERIAA